MKKFNMLGFSVLLLVASLAISACTTEVEVIKEVPGETVTVTKEVPVEVIKEVEKIVEKEGAVRTVVEEVIKEVKVKGDTVTVEKIVEVEVIAPPVGAPKGHVKLAAADINSPNGLPRFCTAGCAETIYMSGITDVLFNAVNKGGVVTTEPMVALSYILDSSLESGTFTLREGVQFHGGYGEMTSEDVQFSYNDANSVTNPESIHGQAGDFAPLIQSMEALDPYTIKLNYRNYDSRGILHRFSSFWQTAGIMSTAVFEEHGIEGMQDMYIGVGPFENIEWSQNGKIEGVAFADYYGHVGPEKMTLLEVPEGASRRAMLETGEVAIAQVATKDYPGLTSKGFNAQKGGMFNTIRDVSMVGNYWETHNALTGAEITRDRDTSLPWVGNPFENGDYDENTPSMVSSQKVREAFAWAIDREALVENLLGGLGFVNHQAYLAGSNPNYQAEWDWGLDYDKSKALMAEAGQSGGFEMDLWVGTGELGAEIGESVGAAWQENLGVKVNLIKTAYSTYRPGLVARTNKTPGVNICGDENKSNFPYDWAHGFVVSSFSAGGYGVGQEIPYATKSYSKMSGEPDKAVREALAAEFYTNNRKWANCIGFFEEPLWPYWDPNQIESWDMRPQANGNIGTINNVNLVIMK